MLAAVEKTTNLHIKEVLFHKENILNVPPVKPALISSDGIVMSEKLRRLAMIIAKSYQLPALISGETGTGKEEFAMLVHRLRCQYDRDIPFVAVNCASLNSSLTDSILFGHMKGAFSGAERTTLGFIGKADGGILFLDEIHALSPETQTKLLRVMNDGSYMRVGSSTPLRSRFQVIAASTKNLDDLVDQGEFLLDLRSRISGFDVYIPPLRERPDEIPLLIDMYFNKAKVAIDSHEAALLARRCSEFYWQGNIRQLFRALQVLVVNASCDEAPISLKYLPVYKSMLPPSQTLNEDEKQTLVSPVSTNKMSHEPRSMQLLRKALSEDVNLKNVMRELEKSIVEAAIQRHTLLSSAYRALGIGRNTFDTKRKRLGIHISRMATLLMLTAMIAIFFPQIAYCVEKVESRPRVRVEAAAVQEIAEELRYPARIEGVVIDVFPTTEGLVTKHAVKIGDVISQGGILFYVRNDTLGFTNVPQPVRSPAAGRVLELPRVSQRLSKNAKSASVMQMNSIHLVIETLLRDLERISRGLGGVFTTSNAANHWPVVVDDIGASADLLTGTAPTRLRFAMPKTSVLPSIGVIGFVTLKINQRQAIFVPAEIILRENEQNFIWIARDRRIEVRPIKLGEKRQDLVEVTSGLKPGDLFVIKSTSYLKHDDEIVLEKEGHETIEKAL